MSRPYSRKPDETPPPPSRNFSHPNRQRDPTLSPDHNQDNPPMAPNDSRRMLPTLPTHTFSRSSSNVSLLSERHPHTDFDFSYESARRPGTSHTAISSYSTPDLSATALPPYPPRDSTPIPRIPQQFGGPPPDAINPPSPRTPVRLPPRSPTKSAKSGKGSGWRRLKLKVKRAFSFGRQKKKPLNIGLPTDFRHNQTQGHLPLRAPGTGALTAAPRLPGGGGRGVMMPGGLGGGLDQRSMPSTSHGAGVGTTGANLGGGAMQGGLGYQGADGSAVSDDGDSSWEDEEATRLFHAYQRSLRGRS